MQHNVCKEVSKDRPNINHERRSIILASLGSILEYYDFVIYGMLAKYLKAAFFPANDDTVALLQFFSVFALGYLARPFGGIIAGVVGDRKGRKPIFFILTLLMAFCTLIIGFLPSYAEAGFIATLLLVLCRLGQGLSFGGELPGATTIVGEFSAPNKRAFRVSFVVASTSIGALSASFVLFCLTNYLSDNEIIQWGWRIPFIIGGIFGMVLFWARKNLSETPLFQLEKNGLGSLECLEHEHNHNQQKHHNPLKKLFLENKQSVFAGIFLTAFFSAMIIGNLFFPFYINKYYQFPEKSIYLAATISLIFSALILPLTGKVADKFSRINLLKWTTLSFLSSSIFLFKLLSFQSNIVLILFLIIHQLFIAFFASCYYPIIIALFPTQVRYTGIATCYNITYALMGMLPALLTFLLDKFALPMVMPITLSVMALISFIAVCWIEQLEVKVKASEKEIDSKLATVSGIVFERLRKLC